MSFWSHSCCTSAAGVVSDRTGQALDPPRGWSLCHYEARRAGECFERARSSRSRSSSVDDSEREVAGRSLERSAQAAVDARKLLNPPSTPGVLQYRKVLEDNITGDTPYAQIAFEYEVEMLPLWMKWGRLSELQGAL